MSKKKGLQLDAWRKYPLAEVDAVLNPLAEWIDKVSPTAKQEYPTSWNTEWHIVSRISQTSLAVMFEDGFANQFQDMERRKWMSWHIVSILTSVFSERD